MATFFSWVRGASAPGALAEDAVMNPQINNRADLIVAQGLPIEAEVVRMGNSYMVIGSAVAPVVALPTTAAHLSLWNGEADGGKSYIISLVGSLLAVTAAAAINTGLAAQLNIGRQSNPAGAVVIKGLSGFAYRGKGNAKASVTVVNDAGWHPVGPSIICANTANAMLNNEQNVWGRYIVPPGGIFSLATLCNAAGTATGQPYIIFHEVQLTLG